jgi:hypothetical protein
MSKEHEGTELVESQAPATLMIRAMEKNMKPEEIKQMMDLQERWEANQARKAYFVAMAAFKADPPEIEKDRQVKFQTSKGTTEFRHATLGNVTTQINASLSKHGLSAAWETIQNGTQVTVICRISHALGHSETTSLTAGLDDSGGKNVIQQLGSTISYLERYTILALTGLATHDQDDDGKGTQPEVIELISDKQKGTIVDLLNSKGITEVRLLKYLGVETLDQTPAKDYNKAVASIKATPEKKGKVE